ncbi:hypothetical protein LX36DRAFT_212351 [Colletotrichum falcatum]|nr:hypothetical protein LX36DRAFT_212351 [Colletotrichum falcatum]
MVGSAVSHIAASAELARPWPSGQLMVVNRNEPRDCLKNLIVVSTEPSPFTVYYSSRSVFAPGGAALHQRFATTVKPLASAGVGDAPQRRTPRRTRPPDFGRESRQLTGTSTEGHHPLRVSLTGGPRAYRANGLIPQPVVLAGQSALTSLTHSLSRLLSSSFSVLATLDG